jgi:ComF family protein
MDSLCGACQRRPPPFAVCHTAFRYEEPVPALVGGAKFRARLNLLRLLGQCLALSLRERNAEMPGLILPVPLHVERTRERGYNQALEIARTLSRELSVPVDSRCCARIFATTPQTGLRKQDRRRNVRGAFRVLDPLKSAHVAILDDVVTTGSTVSELTRVLLKAGVKQVDVWAVARTP